MKRIKLSMIIAIMAIVTFTSCEKDIPGAGVYFGTAVSDSINEYTLFIDGASQGTLPYFEGIPKNQDRSELMYIIMEGGTHAMKITDKEGKTTLDGNLKATGRTLLFTNNEGKVGIDTYVSFDQGGTAILHYTP